MMKKKYDKIVYKIDLWKEFHKEDKDKLTKKEFMNYVNIIFDSIIEYIITGGYFIMPFHLGSIKIIRKTDKKRTFINPNDNLTYIKSYFVNFKKTKEYREEMKKKLGDEFFKLENKNKFLVPFDNKETGGAFFSIVQEIDEEYERKSYLPYAFFNWKAMRYFKLKFYNYLKTTKQIPTYYEQNKHRPYYRKNTKKIT